MLANYTSHAAQHDLTNRPEAASGLERTLQWQLTDLDPGVWAVEIKDGQARLIPGGVAEPDTTFTTTSELWLAIAEGRQGAMKAFMAGKMKVEGDMTLALRAPGTLRHRG